MASIRVLNFLLATHDWCRATDEMGCRPAPHDRRVCMRDFQRHAESVYYSPGNTHEDRQEIQAMLDVLLSESCKGNIEETFNKSAIYAAYNLLSKPKTKIVQINNPGE